MQTIKFKMHAVIISRIFSVFIFIFFFAIFVYAFVCVKELKFILFMLPFFILLECYPLGIFIPTFTKCWKYDNEKFLKRRFLLKKIVYYKDIDYFKNEPCFTPGYRGGKPIIYKKGFFTLRNGKKIEFDIPCSSEEFMKMWRKIKIANPNVKLIELPA